MMYKLASFCGVALLGVGLGCSITADPCAGVTCDAGETCVGGQCVADDPCADVTCDAGETCVDGQCVADDPCADVTCDACQTCVDGVCVDLAGDTAAGQTFYANNGCAACHGANGDDGFAPTVVGASCNSIFAKLNGAEDHAGGTVDGITEQESADLQAWLASL